MKNGRREETFGNGKRPGDSHKAEDRRVLVKMPGNRLKIASSSQNNGKEQDDHGHKVTESSQIGVKEEEATAGEGQKRPASDGVDLLQWGQKKRLRFNNKVVDAKAVAEEASEDKKGISRADRRVPKAEKSSVAPGSRSKGPAVAPHSPAKFAAADNRR